MRILRYRFCNILFEFNTDIDKIAQYMDTLFGKHADVSMDAASVRVIIDGQCNEGFITLSSAFHTTKKAMIQEQNETYYAILNVETINAPDSLYYHFAAPLLKYSLKKRGFLYLHSAGARINGKGCLFLGHRNAGKSTLSLLNLLHGGDFLSDDLVYIREQYAHTIYRPIHIDPDMARNLGVGDRVSKEDRYLKDEVEVNYYQEEYHQGQILREMKVEQIIYLQLSDCEDLRYQHILNSTKKENMLLEYIGEEVAHTFMNLLELPHSTLVWSKSATYDFSLITRLIT
ncbi:hypothetical protein JHL18_11780 [Clostridium sp. YIM B02505]|uniref:Uncharacterized protein n=1 Tax=Clostridium yunnanense TaxID=2800325 RepID=A0ABS1EPJ6_9CLOT|nr:hypothetical protein [Clostridium yunnanense]MBK1811306.1 hypothetical protein [Clostridium yunnanense]